MRAAPTQHELAGVCSVLCGLTAPADSVLSASADSLWSEASQARTSSASDEREQFSSARSAPPPFSSRLTKRNLQLNGVLNASRTRPERAFGESCLFENPKSVFLKVPKNRTRVRRTRVRPNVERAERAFGGNYGLARGQIEPKIYKFDKSPI